jgi:hypothetical protein
MNKLSLFTLLVASVVSATAFAETRTLSCKLSIYKVSSDPQSGMETALPISNQSFTASYETTDEEHDYLTGSLNGFHFQANVTAVVSSISELNIAKGKVWAINNSPAGKFSSMTLYVEDDTKAMLDCNL